MTDMRDNNAANWQKASHLSSLVMGVAVLLMMAFHDLNLAVLVAIAIAILAVPAFFLNRLLDPPLSTLTTLALSMGAIPFLLRSPLGNYSPIVFAGIGLFIFASLIALDHRQYERKYSFMVLSYFLVFVFINPVFQQVPVMLTLIIFCMASTVCVASFVLCFFKKDNVAVHQTTDARLNVKTAALLALLIMVPGLLLANGAIMLIDPNLFDDLGGLADIIDLNTIANMKRSKRPVIWMKTQTPFYLRGATYNAYENGKWHRRYYNSIYITRNYDTPEPTEQPVCIEAYSGFTGTKQAFVPYHTSRVEPRDGYASDNCDSSFSFSRTPAFPFHYKLYYRNWESRPFVPVKTLVDDYGEDATEYMDGVCLRYPEGAGFEKLKQLSQDLTADYEEPREKIRALVHYLHGQCKYKLNPDYKSIEKDPILSFVFDKKLGNCSHFSSATALMTRSLGIPARLVGGFYHGEYDDGLKYRVYRFSDAHAWVEAKIGDKWEVFETTPPGGMFGGGGRTGSNFLYRMLDRIQLYFHQINLGLNQWVHRSTGLNLSLDLMKALPFLLMAVLLLILIMKTIYGKKKISQKQLQRLLTLSGNTYERMLIILELRGVLRYAHETPYEFLEKTKRLTPELQQDVRTITEWLYLHKYSVQRDTTDAERKAVSALESLQTQIQTTRTK